MTQKRPMGVALLGLGTVGFGVYEFLSRRSDMEIVWALSQKVPQGVRCPIAERIEQIHYDN